MTWTENLMLHIC